MRAAVRGLVILGRVHVAHAAMGLMSHSAVGREQPVIRLEGNVLEGVSIDDSRLAITLAEDFYRECDTKDKLAKRHAAGLSPRARAHVPARGQRGWRSQRFSRSQRHGEVHHRAGDPLGWRLRTPRPPFTTMSCDVPNFGKIYFGEMFITGESRRLTMVRFQLGSPDGGEVAAAEGETNGGTWPPG